MNHYHPGSNSIIVYFIHITLTYSLLTLVVAVLTCCFLAQSVAAMTAVVAVQVIAIPTGRLPSTVTAVNAV